MSAPTARRDERHASGTQHRLSRHDMAIWSPQGHKGLMAIVHLNLRQLPSHRGWQKAAARRTKPATEHPPAMPRTEPPVIAAGAPPAPPPAGPVGVADLASVAGVYVAAATLVSDFLGPVSGLHATIKRQQLGSALPRQDKICGVRRPRRTQAGTLAAAAPRRTASQHVSLQAHHTPQQILPAGIRQLIPGENLTPSRLCAARGSTCDRVSRLQTRQQGQRST